jgi:hypothetical protein
MTRPRPAGVTFSAILLTLASLLLVLFAAVTLLGVLLGRHTHTPTAASTLSPTAMVAITGLTSLVYLLLAAWGIATVVGLFRMQPWSRISIIVIGACVAVVGFFSTLMAFAMPILMAGMPLPPNANHAIFRAVFTGMAIVFAIGIGWMIYFSLRSTREAFTALPGNQLIDPYAPPPLPHAHALAFDEAEPYFPPPPSTLYDEAPQPYPVNPTAPGAQPVLP